MRKIKCKAYIKHLKKLVPVDVIDFLNEEVEVNTSEDGGASIYRFDEIELMRYTELTDKNGKEIYEGDILKISNPYVGDIISEVVWGGAEYPAFDLPNYDGDTMNAFSAIQFNGEDEMEVIGNIYEHPHLLKGE